MTGFGVEYRWLVRMAKPPSKKKYTNGTGSRVEIGRQSLQKGGIRGLLLVRDLQDGDPAPKQCSNGT